MRRERWCSPGEDDSEIAKRDLGRDKSESTIHGEKSRDQRRREVWEREKLEKKIKDMRDAGERGKKKTKKTCGGEREKE